MSDWPMMTLSNVVTLQRGHDLPSSTRGSGSVPVIGSFGVTGYHDVARYEGPGVAIGRSGASIGVATFCVEDYWPLNTCLFVKDFKGNDRRWVYYLLDAIDFSGFNSGSAQPSLNRNYLAGIPVAVPPVGEQRAIAATLGALDDKIESNRRLIDHALSLVDAMAERAGESAPTMPLGAGVALVRDTQDPSALGPRLVDHFSLPAFDEGALPDRCSAGSIMSNKLLVSGLSVLVSRLNPRIERMWWAMPDDGCPALASTEFAVLTAPTEVDLAGAWLAVRAPAFRDELPRRVTGTSGSHQRVRPEDLLTIETTDVRSIDQETKHAALDLLSLAQQRRRESASLVALRDTLLPELLSGQVRAASLQGAGRG